MSWDIAMQLWSSFSHVKSWTDLTWKYSVWFNVWPNSMSVCSSIWLARIGCWSLCVIGQACQSGSPCWHSASTANEISIDWPLSWYGYSAYDPLNCVGSQSSRGISYVESENLIQHGKYSRECILTWLRSDAMNVWCEMIFSCISTVLFRYRFAKLAFRPRGIYTNNSPGWNVGKMYIWSRLKSRGLVISANKPREFVSKTRPCADGMNDSRYHPPRFRFQPRCHIKLPINNIFK